MVVGRPQVILGTQLLLSFDDDEKVGALFTQFGCLLIRASMCTTLLRTWTIPVSNLAAGAHGHVYVGRTCTKLKNKDSA